MQSVDVADMFSGELSDRDFKAISTFIYDKCGINLHEGKKELVRSRLARRLRQNGFSSFDEYFKFLQQDKSGNELVQMLDAISTNLTSFFRGQAHFDFLEQTVFPSYVANGPKKVRFWCAGCSTGEEPYSLATSWLETAPASLAMNASILATDLSTRVLATAEAGIYDMEHIGKIPANRLKKYFQKGSGDQEGVFRVKPEARNLVTFKRLNLMDSFPFSQSFEVIFCRNVMIYFDKKTVHDLIAKFHTALSPGGYLLIGHAESLASVTHSFKYVIPSGYQKV